MKRPDFAAIEAFARVAETGSFRAAASVLAAPISTVSVQVSRLEERLGVKLFDRTTRRVALTAEGRDYFEQVRAALDTMLDAERALAPAGAARGRLRIAAPMELGQAILGKVLARYRRAHPAVELQVELVGEPADPLRDGFDVVLQAAPPDSSSLVARKLGAPTRYRLLASPDYLARRGRPTHPRDLAGHDCLAMGTARSAPTWRFLRGAPLVHHHATANSWMLLRELAVAGCGIARLPDYLGVPAISEGTLEAVLDAYCPPPEQLFAIYPRNRFQPLRVRALVDELAGFFEVWPGCLVREPPAERHRA